VSWASLRELGSFGVRQLGGAFFTILNKNTDNLLIGRFLGSTPLGLYAFSYNLMLAPLARVVGPLHQVAFPAFSRLQDDRERLAGVWIRSNRMIAALCVPPLVGVMVTAPDAVPLVFGDHWASAAPVVQVLCWVGILQSLQAMNDAILQAGNAVRTYLRYTTAAFVVNLGAFAVGLHWGIMGVAVAFAAASTLLAVVYTVVVSRTLDLSTRALVVGVRGVGEAVIGMLVPTLAIWTVMDGGPGHRLAHVAATVAVAAPTYLLLLLWRERRVAVEVKRLVQSRRARSVAAPTEVSGATS
jgi:PST family polysaccharide transporter